jgi:hydrogenase maturation protein HypF
MSGVTRLRIRVRGAVQGVGFRPFVHGLAARYNLSGFVLNDSEGVLAEVEGVAARSFLLALSDEPPPLARIDGVEVTRLPRLGQTGFSIRASKACGTGHTAIVPDSATCTACLDEMLDPSSRFYLYPFVTCTDCGPRFTIVRRMPYDRHNTSMSGFPRCSDCARDFADPTNRRFQSEASACPACGPLFSHSIAYIQSALLAGKIVALKGIGGFHLFCDACNESAVQTLRERKGRPKKPFAVMLANAACAEHFATATSAERALLRHIARPIVMIRSGAGLAPSVAPGLRQVGIMLPSASVHHLLFHMPGLHTPSRPRAIVATSANRQGEPLVIDDEEARETLADIADLVVTHDRPILARADDSVMAVIAGGPVFIRRSRGFVPEPIDLGQDGPSVLAVGGHLKAVLCITRGREAFLSQHVGDLTSPATIRFYEETASRLLATLGVTPELVACDLHPDYRSTRFAEASGLPVLRVQHHAAHLAAVAAEHHLEGAVLGAALDGQGYGADGGAWGGELLLLDGARWQRHGHLLPLPLPGGDRAAKEPWRMGVAMLAVLGRAYEAGDRFASLPLARSLADLLAKDNAATTTTTSLGRLFDAAAALLGVCTLQTYEGQAAMELEALVGVPRSLPGGYRIADHILDVRPLMSALLTPGLYPREGAELFHGTLIDGLVAWIGEAAASCGQTRIVLGGGCLLNAVLTEGVVAGLQARGITPYLPRAVPANDGGLSLGQAAMARAYLSGSGSFLKKRTKKLLCPGLQHGTGAIADEVSIEK